MVVRPITGRGAPLVRVAGQPPGVIAGIAVGRMGAAPRAVTTAAIMGAGTITAGVMAMAPAPRWPVPQSAPRRPPRQLRRHLPTITRRPITSPTRINCHWPLVTARRIDPVEERAAFFEAANVVEDDR